MKGSFAVRCCLLLTLSFVVLAGCAATPPGPYYRVARDQPVAVAEPILLAPNAQRYAIRIDDNTPFGLVDLPKTQHQLYSKGYDRVRKQGRADFIIEAFFTAGAMDNPDVRAGQTLGGAVVGAALGAIIGGAAAGEPGVGAAIGAGSGAVLGATAPAHTATVRIDLQVTSLRDRYSTRRSATVDLASVPPYDVPVVVDNEVARMLQDLPPR